MIHHTTDGTTTTRATTAARTRGGRRVARRGPGRLLALLLAVLVGAAGAVLGLGGAALALPPDGPGPETPGTSSRVWPTEVRPGDRLYFEVSGYPANETVYIKIDDGQMCSDTSHGACVYATQALDATGYASGSIIVPDLAEGAHWLRMLATGDVFDSVTGEKLGYEGYTRRGGNDFTVVAGASGGADGTGGGGDTGAAGAAGGSGAAGGAADGASGGAGAASGEDAAGGSVTLDLGEEAAPSAEPTVTSTEDTPAETAEELPATQDASADGSVAPVVVAEQPPASGVPVVGIVVLGGAVLVAAALLGWALAKRRRSAPAAGSGE
ncbi:MAG: hypothetical protein J0H73_06935 [Salana multivorans]|nr:hypothetical protein [Salana multivorans]